MTNIAKNHDAPVRFNGSIRWWQGLKPAAKRSRQTITYHQIGNTLFTVVAECASDATETISGKLERLMMKHLGDVRSYPVHPDTALALRGNQSKYGIG